MDSPILLSTEIWMWKCVILKNQLNVLTAHQNDSPKSVLLPEKLWETSWMTECYRLDGDISLLIMEFLKEIKCMMTLERIMFLRFMMAKSTFGKTLAFNIKVSSLIWELRMRYRAHNATWWAKHILSFYFVVVSSQKSGEIILTLHDSKVHSYNQSISLIF